MGKIEIESKTKKTTVLESEIYKSSNVYEDTNNFVQNEKKPDLSQILNNGAVPNLGQTPNNGAVPNLGQMSNNGKAPNLGKIPNNGAVSNLSQTPNNSTVPNLSQTPNNGTKPRLGRTQNSPKKKNSIFPRGHNLHKPLNNFNQNKNFNAVSKPANDVKDKVVKKGLGKAVELGANAIAPGSGKAAKKIVEKGHDILKKTGIAERLKSKQNIDGKVEFNLGNSIIKFAAGSSLFISIICFIFLIISIASTFLAPILFINMTDEKLSEFGESLGNFLTFNGWCSDDECETKDQENFYNEINKVSDDYEEKYGVEINKSLITSTLTYAVPVPISDEYHDDGKKPTNMVNFKKSKQKVETLAENMVSECIYKDGEIYECPKYPSKEPLKIPDVTSNYSLNYAIDLDWYKAYLEDEFIRKYFFENKQTEEIDSKIKNVSNEIFSRTIFYTEVTKEKEKKFGNVNAICPGVTVQFVDVIRDENNNPIEYIPTIKKTYPLEVYIAGVVRHEMGTGVNSWSEAYKAQAVAARSFVLYVTNNCTTSIENSERRMMFTESKENDTAKKAAKETEGQVITYKNEILPAEFDSFCYGNKCYSDNQEYGYENGKYWSIYSKKPNGEKHKVYLDEKFKKYISGGHGRGLSQVKSWELSEQGKKYTEIINYFYSNGTEISNLAFLGSKEPPKDANEIRKRSVGYAAVGEVKLGSGKFDMSNIYSSKYANLGQCVWYANCRAMEIVYFSKLDEETKLKKLQILVKANGNGRDWYDSVTDVGNDYIKNFKRTPDYDKPMNSSIVSWNSSTSKGASHNYGHVAIVEAVDYDKEEVIVTEGWNCSGPDGAATWGNVCYSSNTRTFENMKNYKYGYDLNGYVYLLY